MCLACRIRPPKVVQPAAPREVYVPCGHCKDCDQVYQASWSFRLRVELENLSLQGWQIGFLTLTYKPLCLPHYPPSVFKEGKYKSLQCFSRDDCESFIRSLRSYLWREYHLEGQMRLRYFLCSEYGSSTQRAHYHCVLAFPPHVDPRKVFDKVHALWQPLGHVFPRYFEGGVDSHGYYHKPFIVSSASAAAKYIAKYTTKDQYYREYLESQGLSFDDFNRSKLVYKRCAQFHLGSRSLGLSLLDNKTDAEKMELLKHGYHFVGDTKYYTLPVYFKNKLIFDNRYIYEYSTTGFDHCNGEDKHDAICFYTVRRLVRREANVFFLEHYNEIFELKVKKYADIFNKLIDPHEYFKRGIMDKFAVMDGVRSLNNFMQKYSVGFRHVAALYLAYYGVHYEQIWRGPLALEWLRHYVDIELYPKLFKYTETRYHYPIPKQMFDELHYAVNKSFTAFFGVPRPYTKEDRQIAQSSDFFGHLT